MTLRQQRLDLVSARGFTAPGVGVLRRSDLTTLTRTALVQLWRDATDLNPEPLRPGPGVALACTGSLARGDGGPLADLDLILLHDGRALSGKDLSALSDRLWYPLWDSGIGLDHSVRTVGQCRGVASDDLNVAMSMLDLQLIAGDADLVARTRQRLSDDWRAAARKRLPEVSDAIAQRHQVMGDLGQQLEPDLKEARGGLRDMTVLAALTRSWLADRPHGAPDLAFGRLLDIRDALQMVTGRPRNRLAREDQPAVAELLGLADEDDLLAEISLSSRTLARALAATLRAAGQSQRARGPRFGPRRPELVAVGDGVYEHDRELVLGRGADPADPLQLLRAAALASERNLPLAPVTVRNLAQAWSGLPAPWPTEARDLLLRLLAGPGLVEVWESLDEEGVIERWIPAWAGVRGRPQRNGIHRHTVDRHLLETVLLAQQLTGRVERPDLLLIAALLHDIGKIAGADDHSVAGAPLAGETARLLGFPPRDCDDIALLVREHLTLAENATRRDPSDPEVIYEVADAVHHRADLLELLLALSEADARAVGSKAWSPWRASLLNTLSGHVRARLDTESVA